MSVESGGPPTGNGPGGALGWLPITGIVVMGIGLAALALSMQSGKSLSRRALGPAAEMKAAHEQMRSVDPALVKWDLTGEIEAGLQEPTGIAAAASGALLVSGDRMVRLIDPGAESVREFALDGEPTCVAAGPGEAPGAFVVGMRDHVVLYDSTGTAQKSVSLGQKAFVTGVAVDAAGTVWVADAGNRVVVSLDDTLQQITARIGEKDEARGLQGLVLPSPHLDVVPVGDGTLLVNNPGRHRVATYAQDGALETWWGKASQAVDSFCGCCNPTDIARLPDGKIVTSEKGLPRVKVYEVDGTLESVVATPDDLSRASRSSDVATDAEGRVYVLDRPARLVRVFTRKPTG